MTVQEKLRKIVSDPTLWIRTFVKIVDKTGKLVPFKLNPQQRYLLNHLDKYNVVCKSRQLGITSIAQAYCLYLTHTQPNNVCMIMAHSLDGADNIFKKLKQMYEDLPEIIKQPTVANNRKELTFTNGSRIIVATCGSKQSARGATFRYVHLSEVAFMNEENLQLQLLAIEQALRPDGEMLLESTANGLNYFSEIFQKAEQKESMYKPFFFSWIDDKIMFLDEQNQFADTYIKNHGKLPTFEELNEQERVLHQRGATIEMLVWRRLKISNSSESQFAQEFPSNPIEAFITTGNNIFSSEQIHKRLMYVDDNKPLPIQNNISKKIRGWYSCLDIWELPQKGEKYVFGIDTAEGLNQDYSVIEVLNKEFNQVAEFKSNKIKAFEFAKVIDALGRYYNNALLVIEKASAGHTVLEKLEHDFNYYNIYKHKDYDARGKLKRKIGWVTNTKTRPTMINDFVELFETNQININSKYLLSEMKVFVNKDGKSQAERNKHDDAVMSMCMAIQGHKSGMHYVM